MGRRALLVLLVWGWTGGQVAWGAHPAGSVHLQVIRYESGAEAEDALSAIRSGKSFDELAEQWAPEGLRERKGYLGVVELDRLAAPVREVLARLGPGQVSSPVAAEGAWFLMRVLDPGQVYEYQAGRESADFYLGRGILLGELGDAQGEVESYRKCISLDPRFAAARVNLGEALRRQAMRMLEEAAGSGSSGQAERAMELLDEAIDEFKAAIGLESEVWEAHFNLGLAYAAQGLLELTVLEFQEAVRIRPDSGELQRSLALALLMQGRVREAQSHAQRAKELGVDVKDLMERIDQRLGKARPTKPVR